MSVCQPDFCSNQNISCRHRLQCHGSDDLQCLTVSLSKSFTQIIAENCFSYPEAFTGMYTKAKKHEYFIIKGTRPHLSRRIYIREKIQIPQFLLDLKIFNACSSFEPDLIILCLLYCKEREEPLPLRNKGMSNFFFTFSNLSQC